MPSDLTTTIKSLHGYFLERPDISMAFLFGSYARGTEISESDMDIAVYFAPRDGSVEWEEERFYEGEDTIWGDVERLAGKKTDLVILNRAPSTLAFSVLREGIPIIIKDRALYLRFYLTTSTEAADFRDFVNEFWEIKQRSRSLSDVDRERLIRVLDFLEMELTDYSQFGSLTRMAYETDASARRNVERWAENIVNASLDISKILLASERKRIPQTYREMLAELALLEGFDSETAEKLAAFSKLRNILAHEYLDIRFNQIKRFIDTAEPVYTELVSFVKGLLKKDG